MSRVKAHLALLCPLLVALSACAPEPRSGATLSPDAFGKRWTDAWNSHDADRILTYYAEDAFYEDVPNVENGWDVPLRGHEMIHDAVVKTFQDMPDLEFGFVSASGAGDRMVVEWTMTGTRYRDFTGRFSTRAVSVIKLTGDKIVWQRDYYDAYGSLSQLGMVPSLELQQPTASGDSTTR